MMQFVMQPGMVYQYPLWGVGLLLVGLAVLGAVVFALAAHQFLSVEFRRRHNDVTAAIFSVIGVTFAVLLAFVAMLAWDGFNKAKAASYAEASSVLDVYNALSALPTPRSPRCATASSATSKRLCGSSGPRRLKAGSSIGVRRTWRT